MRLDRIDKALKDCGDHLASTGTSNPEIEYLLTSSILVIIYAEFELKVRAIVEDRAATVVDSDIGNFIVEATPNVLRGIRIGQLADFLGKFRPEYKAYFESRLLSDSIAKQYYDNLITHRHSTAHSTGSVVTLNDVKAFYARGHLILDYFQETLSSQGTATY